MSKRADIEIDRKLSDTAAEYAEEERAAAAEEARDVANSRVFSVRLSPGVMRPFAWRPSDCT